MNKSYVIQNNQATTRLLNELKSSPKQYPPLNKKQEEELIMTYRNDRDKLNELLYMHNIRLVFNMAKKYATKTNDFDSLISDCLYGLAEACRRFDIDKGIKFSTYATNWIFKYCLVGFNGKNKDVERNSISLDQITNATNSKANNGNEVTFESYVNEYIDPNFVSQKTITQELSSIEQKNLCSNLLKRLDADDSLSATAKAIFMETFYNNGTMKDIADKYKVSIKDVSQIKRSILGKFKNILVKEYNIKTIDDVNII